jgi:hypothetical protein
MNELKWEEINHNNGFFLKRTRVFGGWLVAAVSDVISHVNTGYTKPDYLQGYEWRTSITFVPDPNHEWKLDQ